MKQAHALLLIPTIGLLPQAAYSITRRSSNRWRTHVEFRYEAMHNDLDMRVSMASDASRLVDRIRG